MNIILSHISKPFLFVQQAFDFSLTKKQKRIFIVATLALACLAFSWLALKHFFIKATPSDGPGEITKEDKVFKGTFKSGKLEKGEIVHANGMKEVGTFDNDLLEGAGKVIAQDGTVLVDGVFKKGKLIGDAKLIFENGDKLDCFFVDGKPNGAGIFFKKEDGTTYVGSYVDGKKQGKGKLTAKDGTVTDVEYVDGKLKPVETGNATQTDATPPASAESSNESKPEKS